jgi:hypothetical protein
MTTNWTTYTAYPVGDFIQVREINEQLPEEYVTNKQEAGKVWEKRTHGNSS